MNVRVVAASNVDLETAVRERKFREDLYYRLNVVPIQIPPLRERREDIPLLLEHFVQKIGAAERVPAKHIDADALLHLQSREWPGNVRQLEHAVQMAFALSGDRPVLCRSDFQGSRAGAISGLPDRASPLVVVPATGIDFDQVVTDFERSLLDQALALSKGNKARAAELLGIKRTTLLAKLKTFEEIGLEPPQQICA